MENFIKTLNTSVVIFRIILDVKEEKSTKIPIEPKPVPQDFMENLEEKYGASYENYNNGKCECVLRIKSNQIDKFKKVCDKYGIKYIDNIEPHYDIEVVK